MMDLSQMITQTHLLALVLLGHGLLPPTSQSRRNSILPLQLSKVLVFWDLNLARIRAKAKKKQ
jgi:hypothetical protein